MSERDPRVRPEDRALRASALDTTLPAEPSRDTRDQDGANSVRLPGQMRVHQLLHGYDEGHRLLASSVELPLKAARTVLALSDVSGPQPPREFRECITAYPISESEWFALAYTWPAAEMHRPGCVWTHTLLIHIADLAHLRELERLVTLFRRPSLGATNRTSFAAPVDLLLSWGRPFLASHGQLSNAGGEGSDSILPFSSKLEAALLRQTVVALYGKSAEADAPVLVTAHDPTGYASALLALWDQQWPRLRRQFSFCTAAALPRVLDGKLLSFQVVPPSSLRAWPRASAKAVVLDAEVAESVGPSLNLVLPHLPHVAPSIVNRSANSLRSTDREERAQWIKTLVDNALSTRGIRRASNEGEVDDAKGASESEEFRAFLWNFSVDVAGNPRLAMRILADVYTTWRKISLADRERGLAERNDKRTLIAFRTVRQLVSLIAEAFPEKTDGLRLKLALFGGKKVTSLEPPPEALTLAALATTLGAPLALEEVDLQLRDRARALWARSDGEDARWVLRILSHGLSTNLGAEVLMGLASGVADADLYEVAKRFPGVLFQVVRNRPEVAAQPALWLEGAELRHELVAALNALYLEGASEASDGVTPTRLAALAAPVTEALLRASLSTEELREPAMHSGIVPTVVKVFGTRTITAYLDRVTYAHLSLASTTDWLGALKENVAACREWFVAHLTADTMPPVPALILLARALQPADLEVADGRAAKPWTILAEAVVGGEACHAVSEDMTIEILAFVLAVCLDNPDRAYAKPLARAFQSVHAAAMQVRLSHRSWAMLESRAPARRGREWDYAERLRDALVRAFLRPQWNPAWFVRAIGEGEALLYTVRRCTETEAGRQLLKAARDTVRKKEVRFTRQQRDVLEGATKKKMPQTLLQLFERLFDQ